MQADNSLRLLLRKDAITLRRNLSFLTMFIVLPCVVMFAFGTLFDILDNGWAEESHNLERK